MKKSVHLAKVLSLIAILIVLFILGACSTSTSTPTSTGISTATSTAPAYSTSTTTSVSAPTSQIFTTSTTSISPSPSSTAVVSTSVGQSVTIDLIAHFIAYNLSTITVPAGDQVIVNFDNQDSGIPHNFSVYTDSSATTVIFKGQIIIGLAKTTYKFIAPMNPGTYFFRCDIHPTSMNGSFIVK